VSTQSVDFTVNNKSGNHLKIIPYIGCKAGFKDIFDVIIPDNLTCCIYDVFGGGGSFAIYASQRFGSHLVNYNDNNPVVVNLIRQVQSNPKHGEAAQQHGMYQSEISPRRQNCQQAFQHGL